MLKKFFPHRWIGLKTIEVIGLILFYATLAVGVYALGCFLYTFLLSSDILAQNSAPARKLYGFATLQAGLTCIIELALVKICQALRISAQSIFKN